MSKVKQAIQNLTLANINLFSLLNQINLTSIINGSVGRIISVIINWKENLFKNLNLAKCHYAIQCPARLLTL